jgi:hypothetical protein
MDYEKQREILIAYLISKAGCGDWHGVSDAANDLRVLEAQHETEHRLSAGKT